MFEGIAESLRQNLGPPLKSLLDPLDRALDSIPMGWAKVIVIGLFIAVGLWAWTFRRQYIYLGAPDRAAWRDLRLWATLAVVPYVAVYWWFG